MNMTQEDPGLAMYMLGQATVLSTAAYYRKITALAYLPEVLENFWDKFMPSIVKIQQVLNKY